MKFIDPRKPATDNGGGLSRSAGKPEWLTVWLANKGQYAQLNCGHKEDLKLKGLLIIGLVFSRSEVYCERCNTWTNVRKAISFNEYAELPPIISPDEPLF